MAHKRKDTLVAAPEWWGHLRPCNKRRVAKRMIQSTRENETDATKD